METLADKLARLSAPQTNGCRIWSACLDGHGYGIIGWDRRQFKAHRMAWTVANGPIPDKLHVLHNCPAGDNPQCINPDHLWLGTHAQNMRDKERKGRAAHQRGEEHGRAKLTEAAVREIRQSAAPKKELASKFGVSLGTVYAAANKSRWAYLD
jgi:hypothetical protein